MNGMSKSANLTAFSWYTTRLKKVADVRYGLGQPPEQKDGGLPIIRATNVSRGKIIEKKLIFVDPDDLPLGRDPFLKTGDIIVVRSGAYTGDSSIIPKKWNGAVAGYDMVVSSRRCDAGYLGYCLLSGSVLDAQILLLTQRAAQPHLNAIELENVIIQLPDSLVQQKWITAYLDASCAAIDRAVETKRKQFKTLVALRKSIIERAVTRGLNASVKVKESGVVHLGLVPAHWKVRRVKDVFEFHNHRRIPISSAERGVMADRVYDYYGASGAIDKVENYIFDGKYILLAEDGANLLSRSKTLAFFATGKFWVNNHAHIIKPFRGNETYWVNLLESQDYSLAVTGSAQPKLNMQNFGRFEVPVPPVFEQEEIAEYIVLKSKELDSVSEKLTAQITTLTAYRKSLIHECVTGKRRISEADVMRVTAGGRNGESTIPEKPEAS